MFYMGSRSVADAQKYCIGKVLAGIFAVYIVIIKPFLVKRGEADILLVITSSIIAKLKIQE
jgi:hypothetical protein